MGDSNIDVRTTLPVNSSSTQSFGSADFNGGERRLNTIEVPSPRDFEALRAAGAIEVGLPLELWAGRRRGR